MNREVKAFVLSWCPFHRAPSFPGSWNPAANTPQPLLREGFMSTGTALLWHGNPSPSQPRMWAQLTRLPARALLDGVLKVLCKNYSSSVWGWNCHTRALNWPVNNERDTLPVPIQKNWAQITSLVTRKIFGSWHRLQPSKVLLSSPHKDTLLYHLHPLAWLHLTTYSCLSAQNKFCPRESHLTSWSRDLRIRKQNWTMEDCVTFLFTKLPN